MRLILKSNSFNNNRNNNKNKHCQNYNNQKKDRKKFKSKKNKNKFKFNKDKNKNNNNKEQEITKIIIHNCYLIFVIVTILFAILKSSLLANTTLALVINYFLCK